MLSHVKLLVIPWTAARQDSLCFTILWSLLKLVLWVSDAIHPSCLLSFPSFPAFSLPQHQDIYQRVDSSHQVAKVLELKLQHQLTSVQSFNHVQFFATPWTATCQASLSITNSLSLLKLMSIESVMPSNPHPLSSHPLLLPPSVFSSIRIFSNESVLCIRRPKYWSFSFSIRPSNKYSGLTSFRMERLDIPAVQGTL